MAGTKDLVVIRVQDRLVTRFVHAKAGSVEPFFVVLLLIGQLGVGDDRLEGRLDADVGMGHFRRQAIDQVPQLGNDAGDVRVASATGEDQLGGRPLVANHDRPALRRRVSGQEDRIAVAVDELGHARG